MSDETVTIEKLPVGILGAGVMGKQLALLFAAHGFPVVLWNRRRHETLDHDLSRLAATEARRGLFAKEDTEGVLARIEFSESLSSLASCNLLIEAVSENPEIKKALLCEVNGIVNETALVATNSSTLSITELATCMDRPGQFLGLHFFNPPGAMKLVEVIKGEWTSDETISAAVALAHQLEREPHVMPESPGFIVNRILFPMLNEAIFVMSEGVADAATVDTCMKLGLNHPMGPLELADYIGLDVCLSILETLYDETGDPKYRPAPLLKKYVRAGKLGRKSGMGFYPYRKKS